MNTSVQPGFRPKGFRPLMAWVRHCIFMTGCLVAGSACGQANSPQYAQLKNLSFEELLNQDVTLVTRVPARLSQSPSAVQVITGEDIRRSGATSIPEALRLASNLQVAQIDSRQWAIDARGFNNALANKLLVMIDGRTIYTPLFAGVFWDVQHSMLADIDRIEVVSGPGATLWGANAVNGVINIVTKNARDTQGVLVEAGGGSLLQDFGAIRYGGSSGTNLFYRVYGMRFDRNSTVLPSGREATNSWDMTHGGFRADWHPSGENILTFQGDVYSGSFDQATDRDMTVDGQNVLGRWVHTISDESEFSLQAYFDRTWRRSPRVYNEDLKTYDVDLHHRFPIGERQSVTWGGGYRLAQDDVGNSSVLAFLPARRNLQIFSAFIQDDIVLVRDRLNLTLGSKMEHNDYTGLEFEPSGRIAWTIDPRQVLWSAVSRAVRTPSRVDTDFRVPGEPPYLFSGDRDFKSEEVVALELGYRVRPYQKLALSVATFYNFYDNIRSLEPVGTNSYLVQNKNRAESWGAEFSGTYQPTGWWRLRGGYTYLNRYVRRAEGGLDLNRGRAEGNDPQNQVVIQSMLNLPYAFELDLTGRYVDSLPSPHVPAYLAFDARLGWRPNEYLEFSLAGQNLWDNRHPEFGSQTSRQEIPRSIYGKVTWRF
jgi:iron complex outermembrane receptor protein